jgi:hypothetical protein
MPPRAHDQAKTADPDNERDFRMQAHPETFFTTDHYRGYPTVLGRLTRVRAVDVRDILEQAWRRSAPTRLIAEYEKRGPPRPSGRSPFD